jgi:hypothetical protein
VRGLVGRERGKGVAGIGDGGESFSEGRVEVGVALIGEGIGWGAVVGRLEQAEGGKEV